MVDLHLALTSYCGRKVSSSSTQCLHVNIIRDPRGITSGLEVRSGTRALDHLLDNVFNFVPVVVGERGHINAEVVRNLFDHFVAFSAANEADRDTDTSKAAGTTNAMKVSLRVGIAMTVVWEILSSSQRDETVS